MVPPRVEFDAATRNSFGAADARRDALRGVSNKVRALRPSNSQEGVSAKVLEGVSNNASIPGGRETTSRVLARYAKASARSRGSQKGDRRVLRFPSFRTKYAEGRSYYSDVWRYIQAWAFRTLNDLQGDHLPPPGREQLAELFEARIRDRGHTWAASPRRRRGRGLELATVHQLAQDAAEAALRDWNADWIQSRREAGKRGGKNSRGHRPALVTTDAVTELNRLLAQHPELTRPQQAEWLGWSESSLARVVRLSRNSAD